ncbi:hypothetical protein [Saccharothrix yanglingensis]|uniref:ATP-grasp domain-containing protein n=1 Tax=Saccharothrix yanglingensis TaxID=659496 RepID=A0ABU0X3I2_9PSEU|nr:hypothetical protein [Saccharothrix yanglingensis]MDQ2586687.1 hypothetical protein [Saccharothrix yanglingensis]
MRPALRLGAFDAERSWRPADLARLPAARRAGHQVEAMDELLAGLCAPTDTLVTRRPLAPGLRAGLAAAGLLFRHHVVRDGPAGTVEELFGADPAAPDLLRRHDLAPYAVTAGVVALDPTADLPAVDDVARVNSKVWSNDLVVELGLPGAGVVVRSSRELERAVTAVAGPAVVKDPYGVSGGGALEVRTPGVLRAITRVLDGRVAAGERVELVVQPLYDKRHDLSAHVDVGRDGAWRWRGACLGRNRGFRYAGSGPLDGAAARVEPALREAAGEVARRASAEGYRGPLSVDAMVLADGLLVPVLEVNARVTLGRLALELDRRWGGERGRCHLWQAELAVPPGTGVDDLVRAVREDDLHERCVVLGGGVVAPPTGRVHCALLCGPTGLADLRERVLTSFGRTGARERGAARAA